MSTHTTRTITSTRREWIVPAAEPWGAAAAEVGKAWTAAQVAYREQHAVPVGEPLPDNALSFRPRDDEIVISFTVEVEEERPQGRAKRSSSPSSPVAP